MFDVVGGGCLTLHRGHIRCSVAFSERVLGPASLIAAGRLVESVQAGMNDEDAVKSSLVVSDWDGRRYRCERLITASKFFDLLRVSCPFSGAASVLLADVRCIYERRWPLATVGIGGEVFAYRGKHVSVQIDLLAAQSHDVHQLVIRVQPTAGGALDDSATPEVIAVNDWAARIVLGPVLFEEPETDRPLVFLPLDGSGDPQPDVRFTPRA